MPDTGIDIARLQEQVKSLRDKQETDHLALVALQKDRDRALIWGILVLGSTVISLGTWIINMLIGKLPQ